MVKTDVLDWKLVNLFLLSNLRIPFKNLPKAKLWSAGQKVTWFLCVKLVGKSRSIKQTVRLCRYGMMTRLQNSGSLAEVVAFCTRSKGKWDGISLQSAKESQSLIK